MTDLLSDLETPSDAELISRVRGGDVAAYGDLFSRHVDSANRLARQLVRGPDSDDLVSEAFAKVLQVLQGGGGPDVAFRAYLLTAVRRLHIDRVRAGAKVQASDDMEEFDPGVPFQDTAVAQFESGAAARAFATLPERWQLVLWHLEVEGQKPAEIATLLGMSANSVSALAYRAREGLRQAFLTMHLNDITETDCRWVNEHLGAYVRKGLSKRDSTKVQQHLDGCRRCTAMYLELTEVNSNLRGIIAPVLLGAAAAGYLSSTGAAGGLGLSAVIGRARDLVLANAGTATAGAVAAGVAAVATAGIVLLPSSSPERVVSADEPVVRTSPELSFPPSPSAGAGRSAAPSPSPASPEKSDTPAPTPAAAELEPAALVDEGTGTTSGPAALPSGPGVLPAPAPGDEGPGQPAGPGPGTDPGTDPATDPATEPGTNPKPAPDPGPIDNPDPLPEPDPDPDPDPGPGPGPAPTDLDPTDPGPTDPAPGGDNGGTDGTPGTDNGSGGGTGEDGTGGDGTGGEGGGTGSDGGGTTGPELPALVANLAVPETVSLDSDSKSLEFNVSGIPDLLMNFDLELTAPAGVSFADTEGTCTPDKSGTVATCTIGGGGGTTGFRVLEASEAATLPVSMPLLIPANQESTTFSVALSVPDAYTLGEGNTTLTANYTARADVSLTAPPTAELLTGSDPTTYSLSASVAGIPEGYVGPVTVSLPKNGTFPDGTKSQSFESPSGGAIPLSVVGAAGETITLRVESLPNFEDPTTDNNDADVTLGAVTPDPPTTPGIEVVPSWDGNGNSGSGTVEVSVSAPADMAVELSVLSTGDQIEFGGIPTHCAETSDGLSCSFSGGTGLSLDLNFADIAGNEMRQATVTFTVTAPGQPGSWTDSVTLCRFCD